MTSPEGINDNDFRWKSSFFQQIINYQLLIINFIHYLCTQIHDMVQKQILLINDLAGYGKVATAAMLPILSYMGHPVYNLPTALVSNTLDYGKFNIMETTDYMEGVFPVWKELGFSFDAIATGFICSERQARLVADYCREQAAHGTVIYVDPIMGDEGKLYNGVTPDRVECMREMIGVANLIFPNYTEAAYLTGSEYHPEGVSWEEARRLIDELRAIGARSVLITSMLVKDEQGLGHNAVAGFNEATNEYFLLPYTEIPVHFPGTGDMFSAILIGHLMNDVPLKHATRRAMDALSRLIAANKDNVDKNRGIPVEHFLDMI